MVLIMCHGQIQRDVCSPQAENVSICKFVTAILKNMSTYSSDDSASELIKLLSDW